jgi:CelD/BcsL family acetyltransferase involved in cellulose biosynthesis
MPPYRVETVPPSGLADIRDGWERLWASVHDATPFQSPAWLLPWVEVYAPGRCWAAVLRENDAVIAILPVFVWDGALLVAGTGPSDMCGALFAEGAHCHLAALLSALIASVPEPFARIDLQQLEDGGPLATGALPAGWRARLVPGDPCLALPLSGEDGMAHVPARMRSNWAYAARRFLREGGVVSRIGSAGGGTAVHLHRLHGARWQAKGEAGVLADPLLATFLHRVIPSLDEAGVLRAYEMNLAGETLGILVAMRGASSVAYYLSGFDPVQARFSPGTLLVGAAMRDAAAEGVSAFDFLRGGEAYKRRWGAVERPKVRRILERVSP